MRKIIINNKEQKKGYTNLDIFFDSKSLKEQIKEFNELNIREEKK